VDRQSKLVSLSELSIDPMKQQKSEVPSRQSPMHSLTFKDATLEDVQSIADLHTESWRRFYRGILPDAYLNGPIVEERREAWNVRLSSAHSGRQLVHMALDGMNLVGFTCVLADAEPERGILLDNLHVLSRHQGRGIGRQLFGKSDHWANQVEPGRPMHLWVFEANRQARRFYETLSGRIVDRQLKNVAGVDVASLCYLWDDPSEAIALCKEEGWKRNG
jgi:GNAT superfamily N-acetyltransferase